MYEFEDAGADRNGYPHDDAFGHTHNRILPDRVHRGVCCMSYCGMWCRNVWWCGVVCVVVCVACHVMTDIG